MAATHPMGDSSCRRSSPRSSKATKVQVIVMANLFHGRSAELRPGESGADEQLSAQRLLTFDLKGVFRHGGDLQKCIDHAAGFPIALEMRSEAFLRDAYMNDTLYLSTIDVIDYSIMLGIDAERGELVVGIIDYLRQYDYLKMVEAFTKTAAESSGAVTNQTAIVNPQKYRYRFLAMMDTLFTPAPR